MRNDVNDMIPILFNILTTVSIPCLFVCLSVVCDDPFLHTSGLVYIPPTFDGIFGCAKFNFASNSFAATLYKRVLTGKFLLSVISDLSYSQKKNIWFYCPPCPAFLSQNLYVCTVCTCLKRLSQATAHSVDFAQDCFHMTFVKNFFPNFLSLI